MMILIGEGGCFDPDGGSVHDLSLVNFGVDLFFGVGGDCDKESGNKDHLVNHTWNLCINNPIKFQLY